VEKGLEVGWTVTTKGNLFRVYSVKTADRMSSRNVGSVWERSPIMGRLFLKMCVYRVTIKEIDALNVVLKRNY
jgi:hypothetical protein